MKKLLDKILQHNWLVLLIGLFMLHSLNTEIVRISDNLSNLQIKGYSSKKGGESENLNMQSLKLIRMSARGHEKSEYDDDFTSLFRNKGEELYSKLDLYNLAYERATKLQENNKERTNKPQPAEGMFKAVTKYDKYIYDYSLDSEISAIMFALGSEETQYRERHIGIASKQNNARLETKGVFVEDKINKHVKTSKMQKKQMYRNMLKNANIKGYTSSGIWIDDEYVVVGDMILDHIKLKKIYDNHGVAVFQGKDNIKITVKL